MKTIPIAVPAPRLLLVILRLLWQLPAVASMGSALCFNSYKLILYPSWSCNQALQPQRKSNRVWSEMASDVAITSSGWVYIQGRLQSEKGGTTDESNLCCACCSMWRAENAPTAGCATLHWCSRRLVDCGPSVLCGCGSRLSSPFALVPHPLTTVRALHRRYVRGCCGG